MKYSLKISYSSAGLFSYHLISMKQRYVLIGCLNLVSYIRHDGLPVFWWVFSKGFWITVFRKIFIHRNGFQFGHEITIMGAMASQPTGVSIVYLIVCSGVDQRKYQSFASLAFVRGIRQLPMNFPHKGRVTRNMFPFDDVTMHFWNTCSVTDFYRQVLRKLECIKATCAILHYNNSIGSALELLQFCAKPSILSNYIMMSWHRNAFSIAGPHDDVIKWKHFPRYWTFGRGIHWSPGDSPHKSQWRELYVFFDLRPNKRLSKQFWGWWFETPSRPLWCHCNAILCFQARDV